MSESGDELFVMIDNEESNHPRSGFTVRVMPSAKSENLRRLVDPVKASGPKYQVRSVEPVAGSPGRSYADLLKLPLHLQDLAAGQSAPHWPADRDRQQHDHHQQQPRR